MNPTLKTLLLTPTLVCGFAPFSSAVVIGVTDFDADNQGFFAFAEIGANIGVVFPATGVGGTNGVAVSVFGDPGTFAGGGVGSPFDLANAGATPGAITDSIVGSITGNFDVNLPVGQQIAIRIEPDNGTFDVPINLGNIDGTGAFQNFAFDVGDADAGQITNFVNTLNNGGVVNGAATAPNATALRFVFAINNQATSVGSDFIFDNIQFEADAVPEPSAAVLLGLGSLSLLLRRRR